MWAGSILPIANLLPILVQDWTFDIISTVLLFFTLTAAVTGILLGKQAEVANRPFTWPVNTLRHTGCVSVLVNIPRWLPARVKHMPYSNTTPRYPLFNFGGSCPENWFSTLSAEVRWGKYNTADRLTSVCESSGQLRTKDDSNMCTHTITVWTQQ